MDRSWVVEGAVVPCSRKDWGGGEIPTTVPKFTGSIFMMEYYSRRDLGGIATVEFRFLK